MVFCTLFDVNFLVRGLAMYESLARVCPRFTLYVFAFDQKCFEYLSALNLPCLKVVSLTEFENAQLLSVKQGRTRAEYCWTCSSASIQYVLDTFNESHCTYLDADLYFFSNPEVLLNEMGSNSVIITPHNYAPRYDQAAVSGKYCVQFMTFKNNEEGRLVLRKWVQDCLNWCFARVEDGKFGDQKYLDSWLIDHTGVYECSNIGAGVAPWNVSQYRLYVDQEQLMVQHENQQVPVVFYHFHGLKFYPHCYVDLSDYKLSAQAKRYIYGPYLKEILSLRKKLGLEFSGFEPLLISDPKKGLRSILRQLKLRLKNEYNIQSWNC